MGRRNCEPRNYACNENPVFSPLAAFMQHACLVLDRVSATTLLSLGNLGTIYGYTFAMTLVTSIEG